MRLALLLPAALAVLPFAVDPAAGASRRYVEIENPLLPAPRPGHATVVLVREQFVRAKPMASKNLYLDRRPLGILPQRRLMVFQVAPGAHVVEASSETHPLVFHAAAGETRLFRLREVIDERDIVRTSWIEDDPLVFGNLVAEHDIEEVQLLPAGVAHLRSRQGNLDDPPPGETQWLEAAAAADSLVFENVVLNHPFENSDVRRAFTEQRGVLVLSRRGLRYRQEGGVFELPWSRVSRIHFAGSRFTEDRPWVGIEHSTRDGRPVVAGFGDARPESQSLTYARVFHAAQRYWREARPAGAANVRR